MSEEAKIPRVALLGGDRTFKMWGMVGVIEVVGEGLEAHGPSPPSSLLLHSKRNSFAIMCSHHDEPPRKNRVNQS